MLKKIFRIMIIGVLISLFTIPYIEAAPMNSVEDEQYIRDELQIKYESWDKCVQIGSRVPAKEILSDSGMRQINSDLLYEVVHGKRIGNSKEFLVTYIVVKDN